MTRLIYLVALVNWLFIKFSVGFVFAPLAKKNKHCQQNHQSFLLQQQRCSDRVKDVRSPFFSHHSSQFQRRTVITHSTNKDDPSNNSQNDEDSEEIFFSDFDFVIGDDGGESAADISSSSSSSGASSTGSSSSTNTVLLQDRMQTLLQEERAKQAQTNRNWKQGNWRVRGFSLDPVDKNAILNEDDYDEDNQNNKNDDPATIAPPQEDKKIIVSCLARNQAEYDTDNYDQGDDIIYVGRTDGSVCVIRLGTEFLTSFTNQLTAKEQSNQSQDDDSDSSSSSSVFSVTTELKRQELRQLPFLTNSDDEYDEDEQHLENAQEQSYEDDEPPVPFEILYQFETSTEPQEQQLDSTISQMVVLDDVLFTATATSGKIEVWSLDSSRSSEKHQGSNIQTLLVDDDESNPSLSSLVTLKHAHIDDGNYDKNILVSVKSDGSMAFWDVTSTVSSPASVSSNTEPTVSRFTVPLEDPNDQILSCDVDSENSYLYLGTSNGQVLVYQISELLKQTTKVVPPTRSFVAHSNDAGVTAIAAAGEGSMGRGRQGVSTMALLTGSSDGILKQWEIIQRQSSGSDDNGEEGVVSSTSLDYWPKLATQKIPQRAHMFDHNPHIITIGGGGGSVGNNGFGGTGGSTSAIRAIHAMDNTKFISVAESDVFVWNRQSGELFFSMTGFDFEDNSSFLDNMVSLCVSQSYIITNGMEQYVCVHDFSGPDFEEEIDSGYDLEEL